MSGYPAWRAFQSLVRESAYNQITTRAMALAAQAALAEQTDRAEKAEDELLAQNRDQLNAILKVRTTRGQGRGGLVYFG